MTRRRHGRSLTSEQHDTLAQTLGDPLIRALDDRRAADARISEELLSRVQSTAGAVLSGPYERLDERVAALEARLARLEQARVGNA